MDDESIITAGMAISGVSRINNESTRQLIIQRRAESVGTASGRDVTAEVSDTDKPQNTDQQP